MLKIVIEEKPDGLFTVTVGDRYADRLCRDEASAVVQAEMWQSPLIPGWLLTKEQHEARERAHQKRLAELRKQNPDYPVEVSSETASHP